MFVIEDLHWADASVRDAMLAFVRTCRAPLMLVLTYRTEELHRQHPFRPVLVELSRTPDTARVELVGLDTHGVKQIVKRRARRDVGPAELAMLVARTEGNPLYVEELLAMGDFGISMMLNDLLLRHVERLSGPAARLARLASVGGSIVEPTILREVSDLTPAAFDAALQESLSANVMVRHREAFSFRHALLREAIDDDLLPEERVALHAAYAEVLHARLASGSIADRWTQGSALAVHAAEAHDLPLAFEASVWAGLAGMQLGAAAAADHFDRAVELWDRVPDAAARVGMTKADLPRLSAIVLADVGVEERVWENLRQSVELLEPDCDRLAAARVYTGIGQAYRDLDGLIGRHDALQLALSMVGTDPSRELAEALIASASHHHPPRPGPRGGSRLRCCTEDFEPALDLARRGLVVADLVGAPDLVAKARRQLAQCLWDLGRCPAAVETFREAALEAKRSGQQGLSLEARGALAYCLLRAGQSDECVRVARAASAEAQGAGLIRLAGLAAEEEATWLIWDGQFDAAEALYDEMCLPMRQRYRDRWFRSMLETARGNPAAALAVEEQAAAADESVPGINHSPRLIDVYEALPDTGLLVSTVETLLTTVTRTGSPLIAAEAAGYGYRALAIAAAAALDPLPLLNELCADVLALATSRLTSDWSRTWSAMHLAFAEAYRAQLDASTGDSAMALRGGTGHVLRPIRRTPSAHRACPGGVGARRQAGRQGAARLGLA